MGKERKENQDFSELSDDYIPRRSQKSKEPPGKSKETEPLKEQDLSVVMPEEFPEFSSDDEENSLEKPKIGKDRVGKPTEPKEDSGPGGPSRMEDELWSSSLEQNPPAETAKSHESPRKPDSQDDGFEEVSGLNGGKAEVESEPSAATARGREKDVENPPSPPETGSPEVTFEETEHESNAPTGTEAITNAQEPQTGMAKAQERIFEVRDSEEKAEKPGKTSPKAPLKEKGVTEAVSSQETARIRQEARLEAYKLISEAFKQAHQVVAEAYRKAEVEARDKSSSMLQQASERALEIETEAVSALMQARMQAFNKYLAQMAEGIQIEGPPVSANRKAADQTAPSFDRSGNAEGRFRGAESAPGTTYDAELDSDQGRHDFGGGAHDMPLDEAESDMLGRAKEQGDLREYFDGKIEINIAPPVRDVLLLKIIRQLRSVRGVSIMQTVGTAEEGSLVVLSCTEAIPLIDMLSSIEEVRRVKLIGEDEVMAPIGVKGKKEARKQPVQNEEGEQEEESEEEEVAETPKIFAENFIQSLITRILVIGDKSVVKGDGQGKTDFRGAQEYEQDSGSQGKKYTRKGRGSSDEIMPSKSEKRDRR